METLTAELIDHTCGIGVCQDPISLLTSIQQTDIVGHTHKQLVIV